MVLSAIQKTVLDDNEIIYLSRGLGEKYNVLVASLLSKPPFPSYSQFVTAVQSYDLRLQSMTSVPQHPNPNMALFASRPSGGRGGHGTGRGRGSYNVGFNYKGRSFVQASQNSGSSNVGFTK